jgi:hypothetical protein
VKTSHLATEFFIFGILVRDPEYVGSPITLGAAAQFVEV